MCGVDNNKILNTIGEGNDNKEKDKIYLKYLDKYKNIIKDKLSIVSIDNAMEMTELLLKFSAY